VQLAGAIERLQPAAKIAEGNGLAFYRHGFSRLMLRRSSLPASALSNPQSATLATPSPRVRGEGGVRGPLSWAQYCGNVCTASLQSEIEQLLSRAYQSNVVANRLMPGLATVAAALNANDQALARIAAVHLRIPDLPGQAARDAMEAADVLIKSVDWNPALHPRAGTPPNPGWFAPTDGAGSESFSTRTAQNDDPAHRSDASANAGDSWVRLRSGPNRIDELADFIEWMANAKPEDEQTIRAEIKRYFYDVGDQGSAAALNSVLTVLLKRLRASNATTRKLTALCLDMEDKLDQATDAARALHLMGHGLKLSTAEAGESGAITAVAYIACERLDTLRRAWRNLCRCALGRR